jgi:hypothetical protein
MSFLSNLTQQCSVLAGKNIFFDSYTILGTQYFLLQNLDHLSTTLYCVTFQNVSAHHFVFACSEYD